jgi:hypothetical protein
MIDIDRLTKMAEGLVDRLPTLGNKESQVTYLVGYLAGLQMQQRPRRLTSEELRDWFMLKGWVIQLPPLPPDVPPRGRDAFEELADMLGSTRS